ncbi:MAG: hypothetical protein ABI222_08315, partial [Opitutaceae bacterium]
AEAAAAEDFRAVLSDLISASENDFDGLRGAKISGDANITYFHVSPLPGMVPAVNNLALVKGRNFLISDITDPAALKTTQAAFLAMADFHDGKGVYTVEADKAASSAEREITNLRLNGYKVSVYARYTTGKEATLTLGTYETRKASLTETPVLDPKIQAFTAGTQILVRAASTNFSGMVQAQVARTGDGDPLYGASPVTEMQTEADGQIVMQLESRYFYMNSYDTEAEVAFAFAAFQALPKNITRDHAYAIEQDHRLDKASSTTYHLRYDGQIVADFIKFKLKPKAYFTFGYRDGIPKGMMAGMGRTYSDQAIADAKQKINEATICENCRGLGVEEIDTGWESKTSGIHEKKWVPCHWCHGTGHL